MNSTDQTLINDIPTSVDLILKNNLFVFDDKQYLQINATAMGTKMVPTYANIFMNYVEKTFLSPFNLNLISDMSMTFFLSVHTVYVL